MMMDSKDFNNLIGKPFRDYGRGPDAYDCWGVVIEAGRIMGEDTPPDYLDLSYLECARLWCEIEEALPEYEEIEKPVMGAIVLFKNVDGAAHFGRMIDSRYFIHANRDMGVHVSSIDGVYRQLVKGFYLCKKQ
jgi:hypothetical protein